MLNLLRPKFVKSVLYLTFAFTVVCVLYYLNNSVAFEKRLERIIHVFKLENVSTFVGESTKQTNSDNKESIRHRINIFNETGENVQADCVPLLVSQLKFRTRICIYNTSDDVYVSGSLKASGTWEGAY